MPFSENLWRPNVVVAAVVERAGRFLLIEEDTEDGPRFNQPAGHWESGETLLEAVAREALEESAYAFRPTGLLGIYRWRHPDADTTYLRFAFTGEITGHDPHRPLDAGIRRAAWVTAEECRATRERHRSPLLLACVEDYLAGRRYPLDLLRHIG